MEKIYSDIIGWSLAIIGTLGIFSGIYFVLNKINNGNLSKEEIEIGKVLKKMGVENEGIQEDGTFVCCNTYSLTRYNPKLVGLMLEDLVTDYGDFKDLKENKGIIYKEQGTEYIALCAKISKHQAQ